MRYYCETCNEETDHTIEEKYVIPDFVGKYKYPFVLKDMAICNACEKETPVKKMKQVV